MESKTILPLIDKVLLSMGALLAIMVHMELITGLPVEVARVEPGAAETQQGDFHILSVTADAMTLDGEPVTRDALQPLVAGRRVVLRVQRDLPTEQTLRVLADLVDWGADVSVQVHERVEEAGR